MPSDLKSVAQADFLLFDALVTVTFRSRQDETPTFVDTADVVAAAVEGSIEVESALGGFFPGRSTQGWLFLTSQVSDVNDRDRIQEADGTQWEIVKVNKTPVGSHWRVSSVKLQA